MKCKVIHPPPNFDALLGAVWKDVQEVEAGADLVLFFTNSVAELRAGLKRLQDEIERNGAVWVCWYKKASRKPTELTEDTVRNAALALDLVDVKVCAVDHDWSGLKLVIRKERRE